MKVIVSYDGEAPIEVEVNSFPAVVGRGSQCEVVLESEHVSRKHLEINKVNNDILIKDLTLANWVSYNDEKLQKNVAIPYFDFAPLVLPGGITIKIQDALLTPDLDTEANAPKVDIFKNKYKKKQGPAFAKSKGKKEKEVESGKTRSKKNSSSDPDEKEANLKLAMIVVAMVMICGYIYYEFYMGGSDYQPLQVIPKKAEKKKAIPKKLPTKRVIENRANEVEVTQVNGKLDEQLKKFAADSTKCQGFTENLCSILLKNRYPNEGVIAQDGVLIILKNLKGRLENIFSANLSLMEQASNIENMDLVVAGEKILMPKILEKLEKRFITRVEIYLYENTLRGLSIKTKVRLDTSFYRRYELQDYNTAYDGVKNSMDLSHFNRQFAKFFIKE